MVYRPPKKKKWSIVHAKWSSTYRPTREGLPLTKQNWCTVHAEWSSTDLKRSTVHTKGSAVDKICPIVAGWDAGAQTFTSCPNASHRARCAVERHCQTFPSTRRCCHGHNLSVPAFSSDTHRLANFGTLSMWAKAPPPPSPFLLLHCLV